MASRDTKEEKEDKVPAKKADPRQAKWDALWEDYKKNNPTKYALKRATSYVDIVNGQEVTKPKKDEYLTIPDDFK